MPDVIEVNAETGEVTERSYTAEEAAQVEADRIAYLEGRVESDKISIASDGADTAIVSSWRFDSTPITFVVNGAATDVATDGNGLAQVAVTTTTKGPIVVSVGDESVTIEGV